MELPSPLHVRNSCLSLQAQLIVTSSGKPFLTVPPGGQQCPVYGADTVLPTLPGIHLLPGLWSLAQAPALRALFTELD